METSYYQQQLSDGQDFQDFVQRYLHAWGIVLNNFQGRAAQIAHGENMLGLEIKLDKKLKTTGNLWIECQEKSSPEQVNWTPAGIDRDDNSWLYGIGDYDQFFLFSKRTLGKYARFGGVTIRENDRKTSRGFLLTEAEAKKLAERHFIWLNTPGLVTDMSTVEPMASPHSASQPPTPMTPRPVMTADEINWGKR